MFDGTSTWPHREDDPLCPLGVYAQTKAAGDQIVATVPRHYIVRTSWVIGDDTNRAYHAGAGRAGHQPQGGRRPGGEADLHLGAGSAIRHLLDTRCADFGLYATTGAGPVMSWAEIACDVAHRAVRARPRSGLARERREQYLPDDWAGAHPGLHNSAGPVQDRGHRLPARPCRPNLCPPTQAQPSGPWIANLIPMALAFSQIPTAATGPIMRTTTQSARHPTDQ